ncbi:hypothetical protein [Polynucleobacter sp. MWH-UH25E]|uniref:hypothetical protein n=1 Tax=Polynucleobacter sp. MWH-UH25E TaxID=1855616 RepID=UPI001BFE5C7E|nr:hypothetical protein [Polynucleobacter sp. MWH-UH25E]QWD62182.1 hypothetical protein ICV39_00745 [Polynucleobacter sp. MWH-UH25E]
MSRIIRTIDRLKGLLRKPSQPVSLEQMNKAIEEGWAKYKKENPSKVVKKAHLKP